MSSHKLKRKVLSRINNWFINFSRNLNFKLSTSLSSIKARNIRAEVIKENGGSVVDDKLLKDIKSYCSQRFGSEKHWPWIALYTDMRGEYKQGWVPADYYRFHMLKKGNPDSYSLISTQKCIDHKLFTGFSFSPILTRVSKIYYNSNNERLSEEEAFSLLKSLNDDVVLKKDGGYGGAGLSFVHTSNIPLSTVYNGENIVIQPLLKQCKILNDLHPESVNTLRVFTYINSKGNVEVLVTVLRFGIGKSRCDGIDAGGGFCRVSENGIVDPVSYNSRGLRAGSKHPDTGVEFGKIKIPSTELALRKCISAHESYPYVKFIGWDVAIDEHQKPVLLEWNARHPGFAFFEALFGPLLKDADLQV